VSPRSRQLESYGRDGSFSGTLLLGLEVLVAADPEPQIAASAQEPEDPS
jgi:hypothetical protein